MGSLVGLIFGGWLAWQFGFSVWLGFWWLGPVLFFLLGYVSARAIFSIISRRLMMSGGGLWTSTIGRRLIGITADGIFTAVNIVVSIYVLLLTDLYSHVLTYFSGERSKAWAVCIVVVAMIGAAISSQAVPIKIAIGRGSRPFRSLWRSAGFGVGGSSSYAGLLEEWANPWRPGMILLGTSLYDPEWKVGRRDDRHFITIATNRSGKGRSAIVPNLLTHPGSAIVVDPKGQDAAITAAARQRMGQAVYLVDPFGMLASIGVDLPVHRFNPLADIDLTAKDVVEQIRAVADALIMPSPNANPFWDNASRDILSGVIAHVLTTRKIPDDARHLGTVRDYVTGSDGRDIAELSGNMAAGGLAAAAASTLKRASDSAGGDILTTVSVHVSWLDSLAMRTMLAASDFTLRNLKNEDATIYLVLPPEYLEIHGRFLRLMITRALRSAAQGKKSEHSMLFIMDEFYALGPMQILSGAAGLMSGFGVKLWPIVQNLSQIQENFPKNWETFLGNAGMMQVFAVNDQTTARYLSERLGHHIAWRKVQGQNGMEWVPQGATWFRTAVELARESSRDSGNQLVFVEGGDTFLLRRMPYDEAFPPSAYAQDPYETASSRGFWQELRLRLKFGEDLTDVLFSMLGERFSGVKPDAKPGRGERDAPNGQGEAQAAPAAADAPEPLRRTDGRKTASMGQESAQAAPVVAQPARTAAAAPQPPKQSDGIDWSRMGQSSAAGGQAGGNGAGQAARPVLPVMKDAPKLDAAAVAAEQEHDKEMAEWLDSKLPPPPLKKPRKRGKGKSL